MVGYKTQAAKLLEPAEKLQDRYWLAPAYSTAAMSYYFDGDMESAMKYNNLGLAQMPMDPRVLPHRLFIEAVSGNQEETEFYLDRMEHMPMHRFPPTPPTRLWRLPQASLAVSLVP